MGYTRNTGQLSYLITYDGSGNITVPASFTQTTVTSSMLKADSSGKLVAAVAGTDFVAPAGLSAYVPTTRTITINGTSYDLSADRSWSIVSGVSSFNTRTGAITLSSSDVTTALGYTPVTNARTLTINGTTFDLSANRSWTIVAGLSSFNTRTGDITLLDTDVTGALGYTPVTNARTITINGTTFDLSANRTWVVDTSSVSTRVVQKFTATASQTTFTITGGYTVGMVDVFLNGVKLDNATEFTASNGSTVVLTAAAAVNDVVEVYKYGGQFIANNTLRQTTAFTATAGQTTFTVNYSVGFVDVFYNGAKLAAAEFTATNGTSIVLGTACVVNDIVEVVAYNYTVGAFTGVGGSGTTNFHPKWTASGTLGNSLIFDNGTNVGIGTTNPLSKLSVGGDGYADRAITAIANGTDFAMTVQQNSTGAGIQILRNGGNWGNNPFQIQSTSGGTQFIVNSSGNIGIGTTSPATLLQVVGTGPGAVGTINMRGTSAHLGYQDSAGTFKGWAGYFNGGLHGSDVDFNIKTGYKEASSIRFSVNGDTGEAMRITSTGVVCIGTTSTTGGALNTGNAGVSNTNTYFGTGQIRIGGGSDHGSNTVLSVAPGVVTFDRPGVGGGALTINSNGQLTLPSQPSFYAASTASQSVYNGGEVIVFNTTRHNTGGHYNTSNGRFTAPVAGRYLFTTNFYGYNNVRFSITLTVNGSQYGPADVSPLAYHENTVGEMTTGFTLVFELAAGDYVEVRSRAGYGSTIYRGHSHFSGQLLS